MAVAGAVAALSVAGCTTATTEGTPTTASSTAAALWNPCGISDSTVRAAGVDPATEESGIAGVHQSGWEICGWSGKSYGLTVYITARGVDFLKARPENVEWAPVTVAGRNGERFRVNGTTKDLKCDIVFPVSQGIVQISLLGWPGRDGPDDPCAALDAAAAALVPELPR